jgi:hypothetical protein
MLRSTQPTALMAGTVEQFLLNDIMNKHRVERFLAGNPKISEKSIPSLNSFEIERAKNKIKNKIGLSLDTSDLEFLRFIHENSYLLNNVCAKDISFKLKSDNFGEKNVYLVWDDWRDVDRISVNDFLENFDCIWFPVADDLDVFDEDGLWALLIEHTGQLKIFGNLDVFQICQNKDRRLGKLVL